MRKHGAHAAGHAKGAPHTASSSHHHNGKSKNPGSAKSASRKIRPAGELKMPSGGRSKRLAGVKI